MNKLITLFSILFFSYNFAIADIDFEEASKSGELKCSNLKVIDARWGAKAGGNDVTKIISDRCDGKRVCGLSPNNDGWLGKDPAPGHLKALTGNFECTVYGVRTVLPFVIVENTHWFIGF